MRAALFLFLVAISSAQAGVPSRDPDRIYLPKGYSHQKKWPLIVLLHAFKVSGQFQRHYFGLGQQRMNKKGFVLFVPGTVRDLQGHRVWNAHSYCCNTDPLPPNDVDYLVKAIQDTIAKYNIDPTRVTLLGHSAGGMMAHRLACDHSKLFAGIVSLAGSGMTQTQECKPSTPVSILEVHAKDDRTVIYGGMTEAAMARRLLRKPVYPYVGEAATVRYPSALETVTAWASNNGCDLGASKRGAKKNYSLWPPGRETSKIEWSVGCKAGTRTGLWTLSSGGHVPRLFPNFQNDVVDFLLAQKKAN